MLYAPKLYTVTPQPASRPGESEWLVTGGSQPYTVRRNGRGEFSCSCPQHFFRVGNRARAGFACKHVGEVRDFLEVQLMEAS